MLTPTQRRPVVSDTPPSVPRLLLQSLTAHHAVLDGGWWPRCNDPVAELPGLILALDDYRGPIHHVMLGATGWKNRPHLLEVAGRAIRLEWFTSMPADSLAAISTNGARVDLLVVPPGVNMPTAWAAIGLAAQHANITHAADLITAAERLLLDPDNADWAPEGGRR
ncbi:hypothetical protein J4H86_00060 [Spiractinospora alimapuensis]|uniref:DUF5994 family protein n=1 Tax=Spiractinospora alimapuensis TaxID=2820884 RepID=UPI001F41F3FC|nr:DUF5994 family protein [Spiractinospora alimapuensis]QVQ52292.1 hypothetical protein J4H86_26995 [Spiractinospora alimapuensis]QVQ52310.1 hypothetical protein J4H86_00060 [Spiractinospora alimapuensis]